MGKTEKKINDEQLRMTCMNFAIQLSNNANFERNGVTFKTEHIINTAEAIYNFLTDKKEDK